MSDKRLARIFHDSRDEKAAKVDEARQTKDWNSLAPARLTPLGLPSAVHPASARRHVCYQGCISTYCPDKNSSLTQHFDSLAPARLAPLGLPSAFDLAPPGARLSDFPAFAVERDEISGLVSMRVRKT